jgi:hypothetical protein
MKERNEFLHEDLQQSTAILGFGKGLLYQYVRQQAQLAVSQRRDMIIIALFFLKKLQVAATAMLNNEETSKYLAQTSHGLLMATKS